MRIPANQVSYRRRIGSLKGRAVYGIGCVGGLHLVAAEHRDGGLETLGAGSHPGLARHLAERQAPELQFDALAKSEAVDPKHFGGAVAEYWEMTQQIREAQGYKR